MKRWLTGSNVLSTIAMLTALSGASISAVYAAPLLTGKHVKNGTLTSADIKDGSISASDFTSAAKTTLKAQTGPTGDTGPVGAAGSQGARGRTGVRGPDAGRAYSYIQAEDTGGFLKPKTTNYANPDPADPCGEGGSTPTTLPGFMGFDAACTGFAPQYPHWAWDCGLVFPRYCGIDRDRAGSAGAGATILSTAPLGVVGFTGDENGSFVTLMGAGNVVVTASLTLMHPEDNFHSRVACQPQVRQSDTGGAYTNLGVPTIVSGRDVDELVHVTVTGGTRFTDDGDYDYQVACWMLDEYSTSSQDDNWWFISGNATATTTEM